MIWSCVSKPFKKEIKLYSRAWEPILIKPWTFKLMSIFRFEYWDSYAYIGFCYWILLYWCVSIEVKNNAKPVNIVISSKSNDMMLAQSYDDKLKGKESNLI